MLELKVTSTFQCELWLFKGKGRGFFWKKHTEVSLKLIFPSCAYFLVHKIKKNALFCSPKDFYCAKECVFFVFWKSFWDYADNWSENKAYLGIKIWLFWKPITILGFHFKNRWGFYEVCKRNNDIKKIKFWIVFWKCLSRHALSYGLPI